MPTMFRDFSFNPASPPSLSAYEADRAAMNVSPTSTPDPRQHCLARPPTPPCTMGELASALHRQTLRIDTSVPDRGAGPLTPPSDHDDACAAPRPTPSRVSASLLRMQRQANSRMQCTSSHARDVLRLAQMIDEEKQCTVNDATSPTASTPTWSASPPPCSTPGDEGIDMEYDPPMQRLDKLSCTPPPKASHLRDNCTRVARPVRMRKRPAHKVEKSRPS
ncbi:hypothetical protein BDU57DRAFT_453521 [Ampelomyces quisqualis]|uniref:Uncharacterized protein n=1 Tax=Ampelomyces quisqualis TaxID=50730 RepID=A0A6A5QG06_AMPQU|nr:hypothetical protein BDU57DRAFT_453521 [Ampelomyces quisqualis]